jgi:hypothetical protein
VDDEDDSKGGDETKESEHTTGLCDAWDELQFENVILLQY